MLADAALIDSGASASAFPIHWMAKLGIQEEECEPQRLVTAGGRATQQHYPPGVVAEILGRTVRLEANFLKAPVALLGRSDFFKRFRVTFDQRKGYFFVEAI